MCPKFEDPEANLEDLKYDILFDILNNTENDSKMDEEIDLEISDDEPNSYFPKMVDLYVPENRRSELKNIHALPDNWYELDYRDFLIQRRKLMANVIKKGYEDLTNKNFSTENMEE